ncbi:MAG: diguanylate cyclase [Sulfuricurvum sp.]|jgi:diguanylate cyclase (GGDEF)-like protein|uniref:sensor domain-containing diguanylate cyclase n=1 Tax=Sulfuricurvum sp. TaxID=2025608 RepID=UPI0025EA6117|nr:diguanylate cyclase [Sulfuricurvum sp.]MCK9373308.1 diguanylate cyclase [Sulfuricurvum sp.]
MSFIQKHPAYRKALIPLLLYTVITSFAYVISAKLVAPLSLSESASIFAIWPPTGIALSFLFFRGYIVIPGIFLGAFLLNLTLSSPLVAFEIAIGNTLGPILTYWLIGRNTKYTIKDDIFYDTDTIIAFVFYSVIGALITSVMGTTMLYLNGLLSLHHQILGWAVWFFGDLIGFMLIVPIFVAYVLQNTISVASKGHIVEITLILIVLVLFAIIVFGSGYFFDKRYPIEYLILFPLIWASIRLQYGINLIFLTIVSVLAILGTASGYSQFSIEGDHRLSLIMLQIFIFTVTFAILMMTAQRCYTLRLLQEKEQLTLIDPLTQVGNRRYFTEEFTKELEKSARYNHPISLIMFDIDHFKAINDSLGHHAGDSVLRELSTLIHSQLRASDYLARWGGEEFTIILPATTLLNAVATAEKLRTAIETYPFHIQRQVTCSFGVIQCDGDSIDSGLDRVDGKLYEAKASGRNRVAS